MTTEAPDRPDRRSLRALLAAMVFAALAPLAGWNAWQAWEHASAQREQATGELQRDATEFALAVNRELVSSVDALTVLSQSEIFQQGRIAAMGRLLHGRPRRDWDSIFLLDPNGALVLDTAQHPPPPASLRDLHAAAMRKLGPVVSGTGRIPGIAVAMPIMQGDHVRYVLGVRLSDSVWPRLAASAIVPDGGQARLFDAAGHLIGQSTELAAKRTYSRSDTVPLANWRVTVSIPAGPIDEEEREIVMQALSTSGVALLVGLVLATVFGRAIMRRMPR
jgi:hypothetical protein